MGIWATLTCLLIFDGPYHQAALPLWYRLCGELVALVFFQHLPIQNLERDGPVFFIY